MILAPLKESMNPPYSFRFSNSSARGATPLIGRPLARTTFFHSVEFQSERPLAGALFLFELVSVPSRSSTITWYFIIIKTPFSLYSDLGN